MWGILRNIKKKKQDLDNRPHPDITPLPIQTVCSCCQLVYWTPLTKVEHQSGDQSCTRAGLLSRCVNRSSLIRASGYSLPAATTKETCGILYFTPQKDKQRPGGSRKIPVFCRHFFESDLFAGKTEENTKDREENDKRKNGEWSQCLPVQQSANMLQYLWQEWLWETVG